MTYACKSCGAYAEDIDEPKCRPLCSQFVPMKIATVHWAVRRKTKGYRIACLDEDSKLRVGDLMVTASLATTTCQRCLAAAKELYPEKDKITSADNPPSFQEVSEAPAMDWATLDWNSLGLPKEAIAEVTKLENTNTPKTFRDWLLAGNEPEPILEYSEIILASLYLEKV